MLNSFIIFLLIMLFIIYFISIEKNTNENFNQINFNQMEDECWTLGDDYNACYSSPNCTIGFLPNGSTHCMKKFLQEDI